METLKAARFVIQFAAFIVFCYQMIHAIIKFEKEETGQTYITQTIDKIPLPLILVCERDQYDWGAAEELGYRWQYQLFRGMLGKNMTWGGKKNQTFNQVLKTIYKYKYEGLLFWRQPTRIQSHTQFLNDEDYLITFVYPHGFCISLENIPSPKPGEELIIKTNFNQSLDVYITDPSKRVYYAVSEASFTGDHIGYTATPNVTNRQLHFYFEVEVKVLNKDYPGEDCTDYGSESHPESYADCIDADHQAEFMPLLGCMPPWMSKNSQCKGYVNKSLDYSKNSTIKALLYNTLIGLDYSVPGCKTPCHQMKITSRLLKEIPYAGPPKLLFNFDQMVKKHYSIRTYDAFDFIVEVGSALGLWLGLSVASIFDLILDSKKLCNFVLNSKFKGQFQGGA